jgi:hypothetical protein
MAVPGQLHMCRKRYLLRRCADGCQQHEEEQPPVLDTVTFQNKIPTDRSTWLVALLLL